MSEVGGFCGGGMQMGHLFFFFLSIYILLGGFILVLIVIEKPGLLVC